MTARDALRLANILQASLSNRVFDGDAGIRRDALANHIRHIEEHFDYITSSPHARRTWERQMERFRRAVDRRQQLLYGDEDEDYEDYEENRGIEDHDDAPQITHSVEGSTLGWELKADRLEGELKTLQQQYKERGKLLTELLEALERKEEEIEELEAEHKEKMHKLVTGINPRNTKVQRRVR